MENRLLSNNKNFSIPAKCTTWKCIPNTEKKFGTGNFMLFILLPLPSNNDGLTDGGAPSADALE